MTRNGFAAKLLVVPLLSRALRFAFVGFRHTFVVVHWNGRAGNNIKQLNNAVVSARREGGWAVVLPLPFLSGQIHQLLRLPPAIFLEGFGRSRTRGRWGFGRWGMWHGRDMEFPKEPEEEVQMRQLVRSYFRPELAACVRGEPSDGSAEAAQREEEEEDLLTLHIRSGDVFAELHSYPNHRQAPCALLERVIREGKDGGPFGRALVLTEQDRSNPCVTWLEMRGLATVQTGSLIQDACAILRARNLMVSRSSFSETLARLNNRLRRVYTFDLKPCCCGGGIPERQVYRYSVPGVEVMKATPQENVRWLLQYPDSKITGPRRCNASELQRGSY